MKEEIAMQKRREKRNKHKKGREKEKLIRGMISLFSVAISYQVNEEKQIIITRVKISVSGKEREKRRRINKRKIVHWQRCKVRYRSLKSSQAVEDLTRNRTSRQTRDN